MIAGKSTPDQAPARLFAYRYPDLFQRLIDRLVQASIDYLARQIDAGVEAVQIFDTWAGVLPSPNLSVGALRRSRQSSAVCGFAIRRLASSAFRKASALHLKDLRREPASMRSGSTAQLIRVGGAGIRSGILVLQGNLDPLALAAGGAALERRACAQFFRALRGRPHIFNLGHGILPQTPLDHVDAYA